MSGNAESDFNTLCTQAWDTYESASSKNRDDEDAFRNFLDQLQQIKQTSDYKNNKEHWDSQFAVQEQYSQLRLTELEMRDPSMVHQLKSKLEAIQVQGTYEGNGDETASDSDTEDPEFDVSDTSSCENEPTPPPLASAKPKDPNPDPPRRRSSPKTTEEPLPTKPNPRTPDKDSSRKVKASATHPRGAAKNKPKEDKDIVYDRKGKRDSHVDDMPTVDTIIVEVSDDMSDELLEMYFGSKKGGKGEVTHISRDEDDDNIAYITFESCADAERIALMSHNIGRRKLQVTLSRKEEGEIKNYDSDSAENGDVDEDVDEDTDEEEEDEMFVLEVKGVPEHKNEEDLEFYFENRRRSGGKEVEKVEIDRASGTALIYFVEGDAVATVLRRAPYIFDQKKLDVAAYLPSAKSKNKSWLASIKSSNVIKVSNTGAVPKEMLEMYFENKKKSGGTVHTIRTIDGEDGIYLIYENEKEASTVANRQHTVHNQKLITTLHQPPKPRAKCKDRFFISGLKESTSKEDLKTFLREKSSCKPTDIVYGDEPGTALVTVDKSSTPTSNLLPHRVDTDSIKTLQTERNNTVMKVAADLTMQNVFGNTQLHIAAKKGSKECVDILLKAGSDANLRNTDGDTPLHMASENGFNECVDMLLKAGANVNVMNADGYTPFQKAFKNGFTDCVDTLTKTGALANEHNKEGYTPLPKTNDAKSLMTLDATLKAWVESDVQIKDALISGYRVNIKTLNGDKQSATTIKKNLEDNKDRINTTLQRLDAKLTTINLGCVHANVQVKTRIYDNEQLKLIIDSLNEIISQVSDIILMTIIPHADRPLSPITVINTGNVGNIVIGDSSGSVKGTLRNPTKFIEVVKNEEEGKKAMLSPRNISTRDKEDLQDEDVKKRLSVTKVKSAQCAGPFHSIRANLNTQNNNGYTQLHLAVKHGSKECVKRLIDKGTDVDVQNGDNNTPLHIATEVGSTECITVLLSAGTVVNAQNKHGNTPLHIAAKVGAKECITLLMSAGADVNVQNEDGNMPGHIAVENNFLECLTELLKF